MMPVMPRLIGIALAVLLLPVAGMAAEGAATFGNLVQSRHFDPRVLADPDAVYEALKDSSDPGFCDHSFVNVQEASTSK